MFSKPLEVRTRLTAAGLHLIGSAALAALAAALVFALWYPGPYRIISGGRDLFLLLISVDVVLGPLLTAIVFNTRKGRLHLARDLCLIVFLQLAALGYGLHTVYVVRPVAMVFEVDRFKVVTAQDVYETELPLALPQYRTLPLTGPWLLGTRRPVPGEEHNQALMLGLQGIDTAQRPKFWQPYADSRNAALKKARPFSDLHTRYASRATELNAALEASGLSAHEARFLPLMARVDWVVLLNQSGDVAGFAPVDGFF